MQNKRTNGLVLIVAVDTRQANRKISGRRTNNIEGSLRNAG
jgi:hypothetical protein